MHLTITQNGALYRLHHRVSARLWNKAQFERISAREKIPPPRLGGNTVTAGKLKTEKLCFI
jgi:hypothetical protein